MEDRMTAGVMRKIGAILCLLLIFGSTWAKASTISRPTKTFGGTSFINGVVPDASDLNGDVDTIYSDYNGSITNANISSSAAISGSKISPAFTSETSVTVASNPCYILSESGQSADARRWGLCVQGGGFGITTRTDGGVIQATPISINRSTGVVTFGASSAPSWTGACTVAQGCTGQTTFTANAGLFGNGTTNVQEATGTLTNGQLYIGRTGGLPIAGNIAAGPGLAVNNFDGGILISPSGTGLRSIQTFTSTSTWTKPAGVNRIKVIVTGGGGGGGDSDGGSTGSGAGGGGGGTCIEVINVAALSSVPVTVGAGGTAGDGGAGGSGGTSSFGAFCSASGGSGGAFGTGATGGAGGAAGSGSGGDINFFGNAGTPGHDATGTPGGSGGGSYFGGGAPGVNTGSAAASGNNYGGGGGGARSGSGANGGAGAAGVVMVEEFA